jgi:hypothetical protein
VPAAGDGGLERRSPGAYVTRRDVGWLVLLLTALDSLAKLGVVLVEQRCS